MAKQDLDDAAARYKELQGQIKKLEEQAAPYKKSLTEWAKKEAITEPVAIGGVIIEPRTGVKGAFKEKKITPDWLYRAQTDGFKIGFSIKEKSDTDYTEELLQEIGYKETTTKSYAIRLQP